MRVIFGISLAVFALAIIVGANSAAADVIPMDRFNDYVIERNKQPDDDERDAGAVASNTGESADAGDNSTRDGDAGVSESGDAGVADDGDTETSEEDEDSSEDEQSANEETDPKKSSATVALVSILVGLVIAMAATRGVRRG